MAEIISDGPRAWALDRKLGRALAEAAGAAMLAAVFIIHTRARPVHVTHDDLAQVETLILDLRADVDERTETGYARLDRITDIVRDINGQVR